MKNEWVITYEVPPVRGLYKKTIYAESREQALELSKNMLNRREKIVKIEQKN